MTNIISFIHNFFDVANRYVYILVAAFILIIITYGTAIRKYKFLSLIFKIALVGVYFYLFTMNYKYLKSLFATNGIFTNPELSKLKVFLFLFSIFAVFLVIIMMYVLYTILF
jgi:hypothetical protein